MSWSEMGLGSLASAAERRGEMRQGRGHSQRWSEVPGWPRAGAAEQIRGWPDRLALLALPLSHPSPIAPSRQRGTAYAWHSAFDGGEALVKRDYRGCGGVDIVAIRQ